MPFSIGIITAKQSLENIRSCSLEMSKNCKISYLPYHTMAELCSQYTKNIWKFDGILFSGTFPRDYIVENVGPITKPYRCFDPKDRDYYLMIARLFANNPGIDFSRVYIDAIIEPSILQNVFDKGNGPYSPPATTPLEYRGILRSAIYEKYMETYRTLWREKKFDIFVTRFTNLVGRLEAEQIPYILLTPSRETILDQFYELLSDMKESMIQNSLVACCVIEISKPDQSQENYDKLKSLLHNFNEVQNHRLIIRKNDSHFEVITSGMDVKELTSGYTSCLLSDEINNKAPFPLKIGWGISFDIIAAYKNAKRAVLECGKDRNHFTYLVTESQEMVGPLNSNRSLSYDLQPDAHIFSLAKSLGIAPVNLEKMVSLQKLRNMYEFTSSDLVYFLEITPRSASRILKKLAEGGFARPVRSINLSGTGRPVTVYEIDFGILPR